jgi:hypothetical protein
VSSLVVGPIMSGVFGVAGGLWAAGSWRVSRAVGTALVNGVSWILRLSARIVKSTCTRVLSSARHSFASASSASPNPPGAGPASSGTIPSPPSGAGASKVGLAPPPGPAGDLPAFPCGAPGIRWTTPQGGQVLSKWCAAVSTEKQIMLRVDEMSSTPAPGTLFVAGCVGLCRVHAEMYRKLRWPLKCTHVDSCREIGDLMPFDPVVGTSAGSSRLCGPHQVEVLRLGPPAPEWVTQVNDILARARSLPEACDGRDGSPGLEGLVASLADQWRVSMAVAWKKVSENCPHAAVTHLASRYVSCRYCPDPPRG